MAIVCAVTPRVAKDLFHDAVKRALEKDGWTITHDPLFLRFGGLEIYLDLVHLIVYDPEEAVITQWQM